MGLAQSENLEWFFFLDQKKKLPNNDFSFWGQPPKTHFSTFSYETKSMKITSDYSFFIIIIVIIFTIEVCDDPPLISFYKKVKINNIVFRIWRNKDAFSARLPKYEIWLLWNSITSENKHTKWFSLSWWIHFSISFYYIYVQITIAILFLYKMHCLIKQYCENSD